MGALTYSLCYTPTNGSGAGINPVCSDKKIHVRLRDFEKPQLIRGFERKLTYLITYLVNYGYVSKLLKNCSQKTVINALLESADVQQICQVLKYEGHLNFKALDIRANYKKAAGETFGKVIPDVFPLEQDKFGVYQEGDLQTFLKKLNLSLFDYLFNDAYSIIFHKAFAAEANAKYINREQRKTDRLLNDFKNLW